MEKAMFKRKKYGRESFPGTIYCSMDQQHRATFCAFKDARSSKKTAIFIDSGFLVDTSSEVLGEEDWALAGKVAASGVKEVPAAILSWRRGWHR